MFLERLNLVPDEIEIYEHCIWRKPFKVTLFITEAHFIRRITNTITTSNNKSASATQGPDRAQLTPGGRQQGQGRGPAHPTDIDTDTGTSRAS